MRNYPIKPAEAPRLWAVAPLIWRASRWQATLWSILIVVSAATPIAVAVAFARVIGAVSDAAGQGLGSDAGGRLLVASIVASAVFLLAQAIGRAAHVVDVALGHRLEAQAQFEVLDAVGRLPGLAELEDPRVREAIGHVADVETGAYPGRDVVGSIHTVASSALLAIGAAVLLATFRWWAPLLLLSGWLLQDLWGRRQLKSSRGADAESEDAERYRAYRSLALEAPAAKEVRIFGLGDWVAERAERHWRADVERGWRAREIPGPIAAALLVVQFAGTAIVFQAIARAGAEGEIDVDHVALYVQVALGPVMSLYQPYAVMTFRQAVRPLLGGLAIGTLSGGPPGRDGGGVEEALPAVDLRVKDLCFRYPGSERDVLAGVDLHVPAGRSVAIVGENGAGKTTLVKLLTRLYEPSGGTIEADGAPLDAIAPAAWRSRLGVVFQDFARYPLSVRENVAFGHVGAAPDAAQLAHAARDAHLEPLVEELPDGWNTVLAREFGGTDLSGGQWQRVALARALYSVRMGAGLLILDEPTASLDARLEAELFDRFLELTRGVTTVLISHRFSTVRRVDLIYVIEHGRVVERGSHDELMARQGRYAEMFTLQAARFAMAQAGDA